MSTKASHSFPFLSVSISSSLSSPGLECQLTRAPRPAQRHHPGPVRVDGANKLVWQHRTWSQLTGCDAEYDVLFPPHSHPKPSSHLRPPFHSLPRNLITPNPEPPQLTTPSAHLHASLTDLHASASAPTALPIRIPPELIQYVDAGRNPDIYTREFVELARRGNQLMKGKKEAFGSFRDVLAREMASALPEVRKDVERVVRSTGGDWDGLEREGEEEGK